MVFKISSKAIYQSEYSKSIQNPAEFWEKIADNFSWIRKWNQVFDSNFEQGINEWFKGAELNITHNCLDRHLEKKSEQPAIIWESDNPNEKNRILTYRELHEQVCRLANLLIANGIKIGDRVAIYMPMIPEAAITMLACARIGAIHTVIFAGFSAKSLAGRIQDSGAKILITSDLLNRGGKTIKLFDIAAEALEECNSIESVLVYKRTEETLSSSKKLIIWQDEIIKQPSKCKAITVDAENPLFILYTSGSTGKPKGVVHTTAGYMVYTAYSFANVFNYEENDLFFCTADVGWITGHSYLVYGPLLNGAQILMFEGVPTYPTPSRFWEIIDKHKVNIFYTAPTAIRALMHKGDEFVDGFDLSSLKVLGSVGEPINEEAWHWYNEKVGKKKCPIVDTWWQTETGGILISSLAGAVNSEPSFAGFPLPGIVPVLLDNNGKEIVENEITGNLCFKKPWPSMIRDIWGDHKKCLDTYFKTYPGHYFSGDGAFISKDGLYRIIGRIDDVINVSGHRLGTAEIENVINMHESVSESAVIGFPHEIKGEGICAFVLAKSHPENLEKEIISLIEKEIGAIARPDKIYIVSDLPKTRSGKIMRRVLKKIIVGSNDYGDISTLLNPEIVPQLVKIINK